VQQKFVRSDSGFRGQFDRLLLHVQQKFVVPGRHALCAARGWKNRLRLVYDNDNPAASRTLPAWGLRAEFRIEGAGEEYYDAGVLLHVAIDQVRFYRECGTGALMG
jgi:hypothetical protein